LSKILSQRLASGVGGRSVLDRMVQKFDLADLAQHTERKVGTFKAH